MVKTAPKSAPTGVIANPKGAFMNQSEVLLFLLNDIFFYQKIFLSKIYVFFILILELINNMVSLTGLSRKEAKGALSTFKTIGSEEMKSNDHRMNLKTIGQKCSKFVLNLFFKAWTFRASWICTLYCEKYAGKTRQKGHQSVHSVIYLHEFIKL